MILNRENLYQYKLLYIPSNWYIKFEIELIEMFAKIIEILKLI